MSNTFDKWADFVLDIEKDYSNHPDDRGKETFYGFTARFLSDIGEPRPETKQQAKDLLEHYFWNAHRLGEMHWFVGFCYGDSLFNNNPIDAAKCLQAGLGIEQDGVVGEVTRAAAVDVNLFEFWFRYVKRRTKLFVDIAKNDHSQIVFVNGWINRLHELLKYSIIHGPDT